MSDNAQSATGGAMLVVIIVAMAFFMESLDATVIVTALPAMARSLGSTPVALSISLTAYLLTLAIAVPASGWLADRFGTRTVFCAAIAGFTLGSVLCGLSQSVHQLVGARVLQGLGGAMMGPVGRLVVLRTTPKSQLVRAVNWMTVPALVAPVLGPPIGGFIADTIGWRWIFFLNVPIGMAGIACGLKFVAQHRQDERRPFDLMGMVLNGVALAGVILGVEAAGASPVLAATLVAGGTIAGAAAVRHALRTGHPVVDLEALRITTYRVSTVTAGLLMRLALNGQVLIMPLLLQVGFGLTALQAGSLVLASALGDLVIKVVTTRTIRWLGFRQLLIWSSLAFGLLTIAPVWFHPGTSYSLMFAVLFLGGVARSLQMTGVSALQFADVPPETMTSAATLQAMLQQVSRALGVALSALAVGLSATARTAGGAPASFDFKLALMLNGLVMIVCCVFYQRLRPDAGAGVSGHAR